MPGIFNSSIFNKPIFNTGFAQAVSGGVWVSDKKSYKKRLQRMMQVAQRREPKKYEKEAKRLTAYIKRAELPESLIPASIPQLADVYAVGRFVEPDYDQIIIEMQTLLQRIEMQVANKARQDDDDLVIAMLLLH